MAASTKEEKGSSKLNRYRAEFIQGEGFRTKIGQILIPDLEQAQRLAGFHAQGLIGFVFRDWLAFMLSRPGQSVFLWLWIQGQDVFLSLTLYNLLTLISGPECFFDSGFRAEVRVRHCFLYPT